MSARVDENFKVKVMEVWRKITESKVICKCVECKNHYRTAGATCIRKEIVIVDGKCKHYEVSE